MANKFTGYHADSELPFKCGDVVTVKKGTIFEHRGGLVEAKRSYNVKVDHILNGSGMMVGYYRKETNEVSFFFTSRHDTFTLEKMYGTSDLENLWPLIKIVDHGNYSSLFIPLDNPKISWAGRGGYWSRADVNQFL